jgi:hypothetical protein
VGAFIAARVTDPRAGNLVNAIAGHALAAPAAALCRGAEVSLILCQRRPDPAGSLLNDNADLLGRMSAFIENFNGVAPRF